MPGCRASRRCGARDRPRPSRCRRTARTMSQASSAVRIARSSATSSSGKAPNGNRLAARFRDRRGDDGAVAVVDPRRPRARHPARTSSSPVESTATLGRRTTSTCGDAAGRQHADLARRDAGLAPQHHLAARDVGAGIGDELAGRDRAAHIDRRRAVSVDQLGVLDHDHRVGAARHHAAGRNRGGGARRHLERRRMAADDHLAVETQAGAARCRSRPRCRRSAPQSRRHWRDRTAARRSARVTSCASTRPSAVGKRDGLARQRRQIEVPRKACARLLGRDHFEELLLPRGAADRGDEIALDRFWFEPCRHGQGLIMTSVCAG